MFAQACAKVSRFVVMAGGQVQSILLTASRERADAGRPFGSRQVVEECGVIVQAISGDRCAIAEQLFVKPSQEPLSGIRRLETQLPRAK